MRVHICVSLAFLLDCTVACHPSALTTWRSQGLGAVIRSGAGACFRRGIHTASQTGRPSLSIFPLHLGRLYFTPSEPRRLRVGVHNVTASDILNSSKLKHNKKRNYLNADPRALALNLSEAFHPDFSLVFRTAGSLDSMIFPPYAFFLMIMSIYSGSLYFPLFLGVFSVFLQWLWWEI
jgi:hypothetical protein